MDIPCSRCECYKEFSGNYVCCLALDGVDVYAYSDIAEMINKCPKGYRAKKISDTSIRCWREYDKVRKF